MSSVPADREHPSDPGRDSDRDAERDAELDAAFAAIVAGWDEESTDPVPRWPASEDRTDDAQTVHEPEGRPPPPTSMEQIRFVRDHGLPTPEPIDPSLLQPSPLTGPRDWELVAQPDEHFVPQEPPPLPRGDVVSRLAWSGVVLGPLFLLLAAVFWRDASRFWLGCAAAALIAGFVTLVIRLPDVHEHDRDDGAVL